MSTTDQIHTLDKHLALLQREVKQMQDLISDFTERLESLFATQTEILNTTVPEFERTRALANDLDIRVRKIEKRHELEDYKANRRAKAFDFSVKNWKVLVSIAVFVFGLYEGGRALYLMPSPKYKQGGSHELKKDTR